MRRLKIISMNLERDYVINRKMVKQRKLLKYAIENYNYDIIFMQGEKLKLDYKKLKYEEYDRVDDIITTLIEENFLVNDSDLSNEEIFYFFLWYDNCSPVHIINANCKSKESLAFNTVKKICEKNRVFGSEKFYKDMIIAGTFSEDINIRDFCKKYRLYDVCRKNVQQNKASHILVSESFECENVINEKNLTEVTLKKVLK